MESVVLPVPERPKKIAVFSPLRSVSVSYTHLDVYKRQLESCTAYQIAVQTVSELKEKQILFLPMPMIKDKEKLRKIHARGAEVIEQFLEKGWNLAFLTLGDPTVYSTCMYIEQMIEQDGYQVETVSGIPSFCAAAARLNQPLGEQEDQIHILPGSYEAGDCLLYTSRPQKKQWMQ